MTTNVTGAVEKAKPTEMKTVVHFSLVGLNAWTLQGIYAHTYKQLLPAF